MIILTERSLELFLDYARDAVNWGGHPPIGERVGGGREDQGNLTQMKRAGYITTHKQGPYILITFTEKGRALAAEHGIEIPA